MLRCSLCYRYLTELYCDTSNTKSCLNTTPEIKAEGRRHTPEPFWGRLEGRRGGRGQKGLSLIKTLSKKAYFERGSSKEYPSGVYTHSSAMRKLYPQAESVSSEVVSDVYTARQVSLLVIGFSIRLCCSAELSLYILFIFIFF